MVFQPSANVSRRFSDRFNVPWYSVKDGDYGFKAWRMRLNSTPIIFIIVG